MAMNKRLAPGFLRLLPRKRPPVFIILFLVILCLPMLKSIWSPAAAYSLRDRGGSTAAPARAKDRLPGYLAGWNARVNDHFAGREILVHWNNLLQVKLLKVSPQETLLFGRNGWLFLDGSNLEMSYFRSAPPFSAAELAGWRRALLQRHLWLARQGIRFVFVIAPNKSTIYPEHVPARIRRAATRLDQLLDYLRRRPLPHDFCLVDSRRVLRAAKSRFPVYGKVDSHWNSFGAMLAANRILQRLSRFYPLRPPTADDFSVSLEPAAGPRGDLAAMLSLSDVLTDSHVVKVVPNKPLLASVAESARWLDSRLEREVFVCPGAELPEVLLFRDSFGYALAGFLAEHFRKTTCVRDVALGFHPKIVRDVQPKIVIQEMAERFFQVLSPANPVELAAIEVDR